jgi:hypothetical protein
MLTGWRTQARWSVLGRQLHADDDFEQANAMVNTTMDITVRARPDAVARPGRGLRRW